MAANAANTRPQGNAPLNPERPPQLLGKFSKQLGKTIKAVRLIYDAEGINIEIDGMENTPYSALDGASIADYKAIRDRENQPTDEEKLQAFKNKFELRLNLEFPANGPASGSDADIQAFLNALPFRQRRALMMTQKQFSAQYPNGYTQA
jgi:hypothetical protein